MKKYIPVIAGVLIFANIILLVTPFFKRMVTESVISTLKRDYVPGPYHPGFDPDKVDALKDSLND